MEVLCVVVVPVLMVIAWGIYALVSSAARDEARLAEKANAEALRIARQRFEGAAPDELALRQAIEGALPRSLVERVAFDELVARLREG
jgi:hypothetical protein